MTAAAISDSPMSTLIFDTLACTKKLKAAGVPEAQAEAHAEIIAQNIEEKLATKQDLLAVKQELKQEIKNSIDGLTIRFGSMLIAAVIILGTLIKIL